MIMEGFVVGNLTAAEVNRMSKEKRSQEIAKGLRSALKKMAENKKIDRTRTMLAELGGCSTSTLRNYDWAIKGLKQLKSAEKVEKVAEKIVEQNTKKAKKKKQEDLLNSYMKEMHYWYMAAKNAEKECTQLIQQRERHRLAKERYSDQLKEVEEKYKKISEYVESVLGIDVEKIL